MCVTAKVFNGIAKSVKGFLNVRAPVFFIKAVFPFFPVIRVRKVFTGRGKRKLSRFMVRMQTGKVFPPELITQDFYREVPMDNNAAEQSIRSFCIGKKNWVLIDTLTGARSSAIIYSIAETARANYLKSYDYFKYLLMEIPNHLEDLDRSFCEDLLPWSPNLPAECRK